MKQILAPVNYELLDIAILVGFDKNFTSVEEDVGSFQLCVLIFTDPAFFPSHTIVNFSLDLITVSGTAGTFCWLVT